MLLLSAPASAARDGSTDRPGLDYKTIELSAPNPDLCENACKKDGQCRAWTYSWPGAKGPKAMCALKTGVPPKRSDTCCISGVLSTTSPVTRTDDPAPAPKKPVVTAKPKPAPKKPAATVKPAPAPKKPVVAAKPEPAPKKPVVTVKPEPKPVPAPAPKKPEVVAKPEPQEPVVTVKPEPTPPPAPEKPVEEVKPLPEKPADREIVQPVPAPLPPVEEQETVTVTPVPKPDLRPLQDDEADPQDDDDTPRRETPPDPAKVAACNDYASRAIAQNGENRRLSCGLSGSRWGFGQSAYFSFCMRNPSSVYNGARAARDRDLDTCKRQLASRDVEREEPVLPDLQDAEPDDIVVSNSRSTRFCRNFAGQSIRQARQARRYRCGFGGERWSRSRVRQAQLCRRIGPRAATALLETRTRQIRNCRAAGRDDGPKRSRCRRYARAAVTQAREARFLDCGYGGRRWSRSYERHLRWCSSNSRRKARREFRRRERLLEQCR
ncbi:PAN domain-containing protein [Anderseniella sp. Alg231-50]|uniref:PAN domain-containing protein n=1 Tax=Anderseniella sp. Alg231-50 TaxID=1922226 RepID=UPI00307B10D7